MKVKPLGDRVLVEVLEAEELNPKRSIAAFAASLTSGRSAIPR